MSFDLNKTIGHDLGMRNGKEALQKTLTNTPGPERAGKITEDLTHLVSEAVNSLAINGATHVRTTLNISQLMGYLEDLAFITGTLTADMKFYVTDQPDGGTALTGVPVGKSFSKNQPG